MADNKPTHIIMRRPHLDGTAAPAELPDGYRLRTFAGPADLAPLAAALTSAFGFEWSEERVRIKLTEAADVKAVYVADWQGQPVATASSRSLPDLFPGSGYVHWVGTHRDHGRRGLSAALMQRLLVDFAARGYGDAVLETDDFRLPAIRLYLKLGFIPVYQAHGEDHTARWSAIFQRLFGSG
ncbi:MAG TPA: GNAT family N-acetyltransferase [Herpetosiphonaceae bacterium]|nr:GNAT family N-acetyltransferase [Herpetosiphonaceae bacterium]